MSAVQTRGKGSVAPIRAQVNAVLILYLILVQDFEKKSAVQVRVC